jgi:hypothetical protein
MWFEKLVGFKELNPEQVREHLLFDGKYLTSKVSGAKFQTGILLRPSLAELRSSIDQKQNYSKVMRVSQIVGNIDELHATNSNEGAVFQVASQFNLLEMSNPDITPEMGIGRYQFDLTQGPTCAIACGAGTIFRNYLVPIKDKIGQAKDRQINCLDDFENLIGSKNQFWSMQNGYLIPSQTGLLDFKFKFSALSESEKDTIFSHLRIGIQKDTEVTISSNNQLVTQVYCSAVPISYSNFDMLDWQTLACGILDALYESTVIVSINNFLEGKSNKLFLTFVGGGAFGNNIHWILNAIRKALTKYQHYPLDVFLVNHRNKNKLAEEYLNDLLS